MSIKCWIFDQTVHKNPNMGFDLKRLNVEILLFLFNFILNLLNNLIYQVIDMCASFWSAYSINKWNLLKFAISDRNNNLPPFCVNLFVEYFGRRWILLKIKIDILRKWSDIDLFIVKWDFYFWKNTSHIINSFWH